MTDIDDERLGALFRTAADDAGAPPPRFDHDAVLRTSRRITARRRAALTGTGLALLIGLGGVGAVLPELFGTAGNGAETSADAPLAAPPGAARAERGHGDVAQAPPLGPGSTPCADRQDPQLRALVEAELPEIAGAAEAAVTMECRPAGERGINLEVRDGTTPGVFTVRYLPPGRTAPVAEGTVTAGTASGGTVLVSSRAEDPDLPAPFADRLQGLVTDLAPRL